VRFILALLAAAASPHGVAALTGAAGCALAIGGVYILAGTGWALIAAAGPLVLVSILLLRGIANGG
jgi:hypothetical protein